MIALFGAGAWGKNLLRNLHELGMLHAVIDPSSQAAALAAEAGVRHYQDGLEAFSNPAVKGVVIATPAQTHCEVALAAISAGKDVYIEKPISLDLKEARVMAKAAQDGGRILMVGHLLQYHPCFEALRKLVEKGELGEISYLLSTRYNFGRIRSNENVIWSFSPHDISMVLSLVDAPVNSVNASGSAILQDGIEDIGNLDISFENGVRAEVRSSWLHPFKEQRLVVTGSKGMAVFDDREPWERKLALYRHQIVNSDNGPVAKPAPVEYVDVPFGEPLKAEMQHFIDRVNDRAAPRTDAAEAIAVLDVLQRSNSALEGGRP